MTERPAPIRQSSRLAIIAPSLEQLERVCGHLIQTALKRNNAVLCAAPGLPIGVAGDGPFQGASLTNVTDKLVTGTAPHLPQRSETLKSAVSGWRPDTILACGLDALPLAWHAARQIRLDRIACLLLERPEINAAGAMQQLWARRKMRTALKHSFAVIIADVTQADACRDIGVPLPHSGAKVIPGPGIDLAKLEAAEMPDMSDGVRIFIDSDGPPERQRETIEAIAADMGASAGQVTFKAATSSSASIEAAPPDISAPADATELAGRDEHVKRGLRDAHIHVQLAAAQVFPAPLMYALAIGRPVLALDTPAYRRTIDERVNGILLPAAEPAAVAAGIRDMLGRPDLLTSMARASRAKAERRFDAARLSGAVLDALMMQ